MLRLIVFLVVVLGLGFLFAWFADRPGEVSLVWQGMRYQTSLMVAVSALVALVAAMMGLWWIGSTILRSPALMRRFFRNRRRDRGYYALSQGLIAAGSGDAGGARRLARESRRLLGGEPLVELLDAQTLLLENRHEDARARFEKMLDEADTRPVALRGLFLEAEREGAREAARHYAAEAVALSPSLAWAGAALLRHQSVEGDWEGALKTLETMRQAGAVDRSEAQRKRAVLLTGQAMAEAQAAPDKAARLAREAHRLAEDLVPAAVVAATALARTGDLRRATAILESTWRASPHPEIAAAYVHLRAGDSVADRLKRARKLAALAPDHVEARLAIADAAIAARDWKAAREAMAPLVGGAPTQRVCLLMADIEEGESGDRGRVRQWLARAVRAPRDPAWTADGLVSEHWLPISPVSGRLDAFEWKAPVAVLGAPAAATNDPGDDLAQDLPGDPTDDAADDGTRDGTGDRPDVSQAVTLEAVAVQTSADKPGDRPAEPPAPRLEAAATARTSAEEAGAGEAAETAGAAKDTPADGKEAAAAATVFPLRRRPDDPGVDPEDKEEEKTAFRLF